MPQIQMTFPRTLYKGWKCNATSYGKSTKCSRLCLLRYRNDRALPHLPNVNHWHQFIIVDYDILIEMVLYCFEMCGKHTNRSSEQWWSVKKSPIERSSPLWSPLTFHLSSRWSMTTANLLWGRHCKGNPLMLHHSAPSHIPNARDRALLTAQALIVTCAQMHANTYVFAHDSRAPTLTPLPIRPACPYGVL